MAEAKIRHMFPGGNTPQGFFSYYGHIIAADAVRIFLLKGGPGTGKSTFMKRISQALTGQGFAVEHHHCSSDPASLDGLVIPALNIALIDGTAPHIVDPRYPGCVDEILNLGEFWLESSLVNNKSAILACTKEISRYFQHAYGMLQAAKAVYDDWEAANCEAMDYTQANWKAAELIETLFAGVTTAGNGKNRKLFASAITPDGPVNYIDSITSGLANRYVLTGPPGTGKATLLAKVAAAASVKGLDIETYHCPLDPLKVEHIVIPALHTALITSVPPHNHSPRGTTAIIDMTDCLDRELIQKAEPVTDYDRTAFWELFGKAGAYIKEAKKLHDRLEGYYVPNINFNGIDALYDRTLARILAYAGRE
ncbi:PRK06851 family protein [Sporomusa termitida]|uniref:AAA domain protein n=1 Tax=Sporomusa termitida TaxID=2377 RepID=A0A517DUM4_9FIRM|nr:PRK06851 family protein [Sporomusa termitida]QDR81063.1 AAA domain protein [Sporomusa termitida]